MERKGVDTYMRDSPSAGRRRYRLTDDEIKALWLERLVSAQCATGNGEMFIPQLREFAEGDHRWFVGRELGMAWQAGPSIVDVQATVDDDNLERRDEHVRAHNALVKQFAADAKARGLKTYVRPIEVMRGCTGCVSCVGDTRLRPRRSAIRGQLSGWTPNSATLEQQKLAAEQRSVSELLRTAGAIVRRLRREDRAVRTFLRAGAKLLRRLHAEQRKARHDEARANMSARRSKNAAEVKRARQVAARAGIGVDDGQVVKKP